MFLDIYILQGSVYNKCGVHATE